MDSENVKSIFSSVTVWSLIFSIVVKIAGLCGLQLGAWLGDDTAQYLSIYAPMLVGFVCDGTAMYGRINAKATLEGPTASRRRRRREALNDDDNRMLRPNDNMDSGRSKRWWRRGR